MKILHYFRLLAFIAALCLALGGLSVAQANTFAGNYTALDAGGNATTPTNGATPHSCVRDNGTGLVWEVKTDDRGLRDKDNLYTWYDPNPATNGGSAGTINGGFCAGGIACSTYGYVSAINRAQLCGFSDWRMPSKDELKGLLDPAWASPLMDPTYFPNSEMSVSGILFRSDFWSASFDADFSGLAWYFDFNSGRDNYSNKADYHYVRLVRDGQSIGTSSPAVSLNGMSLSCPATLAAGASGTCSTTASYSNGSSKAVSPTWTSSNPTALSVNGSGSLTAGTPVSDTSVTITANYSEGGVSKSATATVTVKVAPPTLTGLSASCPSSLNAGSSGFCTASASYSNGASSAVNATWSSSNSSVAAMSGNTVIAGSAVPSDTAVTLTATYTENGITKTATQTVSVKASPALLSSLTVSCSSSLNAGGSGTCSATANYTNGAGNTVNATWTSSNSTVATVSGATVTASAGLTTDTPVSLNASFTENGVTRTATAIVTVKAAVPVTASACTGSGKNLSAITIVGGANKQLGDSLEVNYCLKNFNSATKFDIYIAVQFPDGTMMYLQTTGFFQTPSFTAQVAPYLAKTLIPDKSGPVLSQSVLPLSLSTGTYIFYAIPVQAGKDLFMFANWEGNLAKELVNLGNSQ